MIIVPEKIDVSLDVNKLARVSRKMFDFLMRKTKKPYEAYVILLMLKMVFDEELGFKEDDYKPLLDELRRINKNST